MRFLRRQFLQDGDLPFPTVLTEEVLAQALAALTGWLDRSFSPLVTLWVFLGQVLSADHSCRAAVARLITPRLAQGQRPCAAETGAYCQPRQRPGDILLTEALLANGANLVMRKERGLEVVGRLNQAHRQADFRRGQRLGREDHVVQGRKPTSIRSLDREE